MFWDQYNLTYGSLPLVFHRYTAWMCSNNNVFHRALPQTGSNTVWILIIGTIACFVVRTDCERVHRHVTLDISGHPRGYVIKDTHGEWLEVGLDLGSTEEP